MMLYCDLEDTGRVFKNKKISYFNKLANKQFFSLKKNIHIENIISSKDLNKFLT